MRQLDAAALCALRVLRDCHCVSALVWHPGYALLVGNGLAHAGPFPPRYADADHRRVYRLTVQGQQAVAILFPTNGATAP